jgi:hypothetical protein
MYFFQLLSQQILAQETLMIQNTEESRKSKKYTLLLHVNMYWVVYVVPRPNAKC